jgi:predicted nucleic acid-binding protein
VNQLAYLDSSAFVKLVVNEAESAELRDALHGATIMTSAVGRIEIHRASRRHDAFDVELVESALEATTILPFNVAIQAASAAVGPPSLRTLDAIHLATMLAARDDIDTFYCYDQRLADAAREHGIDVRSPGAR